MTDTPETCFKRIQGRGYIGRRCGRPVKEDGMCALHLAAKLRAARQMSQRRKEVDQERDRREMFEIKMAALRKRMPAITGHYDQHAGYGRQPYTHVVVDIDVLLTILGVTIDIPATVSAKEGSNG